LPPGQSGGDQYQLGEADTQEYADQPAIEQQRSQHRCEKPFKVPGFARITGKGSFSRLPVCRVTRFDYFGDKYLQMMLRLAKCLFKVSAFMKKALRIYGKMRSGKETIEGISILDIGLQIVDF
jgi:hypothetical protein